MFYEFHWTKLFICTFVRNWQTQFDRDSDIVRNETKIATGDNTNTDDVHSHTDNAEGSLIIGEMILAAKPWTELEWIWHPFVWESTSNCKVSEKILFTYSYNQCSSTTTNQSWRWANLTNKEFWFILTFFQ